MSPLNAAICTTISHTLWVEWYYLKNNYLTLRSKVKVPQRSLWYATPSYGHAPIYQISLTYLERQKCYGPEKKIVFKTKKWPWYLTLRSKVKVSRRSLRHATHRLMVMHPHTKYILTYLERQTSYGPDKLRWEEAEAEEKIRLKQYVSLRSKEKHNKVPKYEIFVNLTCIN
jgi:hypothetical protein